MNENTLKTNCLSSDSGLTVAKCWCAECKDVRREFRAWNKREGKRIVAIRIIQNGETFTVTTN